MTKRILTESLLEECDSTVLAQWRRSGLGYAADVVEAYQRELERARLLARNLFQMVDQQAWRDSGGDDGQGHYEGDYHAAKIGGEIRSWTE